MILWPNTNAPFLFAFLHFQLLLAIALITVWITVGSWMSSYTASILPNQFSSRFDPVLVLYMHPPPAGGFEDFDEQRSLRRKWDQWSPPDKGLAWKDMWGWVLNTDTHHRHQHIFAGFAWLFFRFPTFRKSHPREQSLLWKP